MDNDIMKYGSLTIDHYKRGLRAYREPHPAGLGLFFQKADGTKLYATDRQSIIEWDSLRAYQDEQRKKGAPIKWDWAMVGSLPGQAVYGISRGHDYLMPTIGVNPVYDDDGMIASLTGQFTNFRWRDGHPKTTDHIKVIGDGVVDLSESPLVYRYPKTGIAGNVIRIEDAQL